MTTDGVLNVGVLGTGSIGMRHLTALHQIPTIQTWAIPVRSNRPDELQRKGFPACADLSAAAQQGVTALIVATDTARHVEDALSALRLGMHVLVEKPVAVNSTDAASLRWASAEAGRQVYVGCVLRFSKSLQIFREWLPRAGRLHSVRIECQSYLPDWRPDRPYAQSYSARKNEGGVLRDLIHEIDYAGWLFGWPPALRAKLLNLGRLEIEAEEVAELGWLTSGGTLLSMNLDYLTRTPRRMIRAAGENGTLEWNGIGQKVLWNGADQRGGDERIFDQTRDEMLRTQAGAFLEACAGTKTDSPLATLEDGIKAIAICDAARSASGSEHDQPIIYP